jgi:hypothetical protein
LISSLSSQLWSLSKVKKQEDDVAVGILECMHKMGNKPEIIGTNDEGV